MTARRRDLSALPDWPALMGPETAAAYLDLSRSTAEKLLGELGVEPIRQGTRILYQRALIDARLDARTGLARDVPGGTRVGDREWAK